MKALLRKIRQILKDRRTRRLFTRVVSGIAAFIVFVTTYALVLPAITMESEAACGIPAHQHDDSCYEEVLTCDLPESDGHTHDESCYTVTEKLVCGLEEHVHSPENGCYDEEGNLICQLQEHEHTADCYKEEKTLSCGLEESEGHHHDASCYDKVLTCGLEAHTHSAACYTHVSDDTAGGSGASAEDYAVVAATTEAAGEHVSMPANDGDNSGDAVSAADTSDIDGSDTIAVDAADTGLSGLLAEEDAYVPELEALFFDQILTQKTGIYYFHPEEGETIPENTADITDWIRVKDDSELAPADMLRVYLRYTIPAGSLNSTNPVARYRLPSNLHLTDEQMEEINTNVNGIANQYVNLDTLEILDPDQYNQYLGIEAVEGTRTPAEDINEYFDKHPDMDGQEYINATVQAENVYDTEGLYGEKDAYLGQDLIFTFTPYTIQKNQHEYDADGQPTKAGEKVNGWLCFDVRIDQIDWSEPVVTTETVEEEIQDNQDNQDLLNASLNAQEMQNEQDVQESMESMGAQDAQNADDASDVDAGAMSDLSADLASDIDQEAASEPDNNEDNEAAPARKITIEQKESTAKILFAAEDKALNIDEISTELLMIERTEIAADDDGDEMQDGDTTEAAENDDETDLAAAATDEDAENLEQTSPDDVNGADGSDDADTGEKTDPAIEINAETYPAVSFEDSIVVRAGNLSTDNESAAKDTPEETTIAVSVSAEPETFPLGTTMVLGAVDNMDTVASAVEGAVEGQTRGFHAVDISFIDLDGNEIEPLKPIKVSMTSEAIKQAVEDSSTVPVVVHIENPVTPADSAVEDSATADAATASQTDADATSDMNPEGDPGTPSQAESTSSAPTATIVESNETTSIDNAANKKDTADTLYFDAGSFSVYAIVYTVDFHWEVDGKTYDFSIPGGGFVSFYNLIEILGIEVNDANTDKDEIQDLVDGVESIAFSNPDLVNVSKIEEDTTVGAIKDRLGLECEYSAELTEEQIAEFNAQEAKAGDWALISLKHFDTEESLTVTMKNGDQWTVKVTDANVPVTSLNASEGYIIYTVYNDGTGDKYYALRDDGGTGVFSSLEEMDEIGNEYKWKFTRSYTENTFWQADNGYTYYFIRSYNDDSIYVNLHNDGSLVVQKEAADTFVANHPNTSGAYAFGGSKQVRYNFAFDYNLPIPLQMNTAGSFTADIDHDYWGPVPGKEMWIFGAPNYDYPTYAPMYIYQQPGSAYEFTVQTENIEHGYVTGLNTSGEQADNNAIYQTKTNADGLSTKTNRYDITAIPQNNRIRFDKWTLDGEDITVETRTTTVTNSKGNQVQAVTIPAGKLPVDRNGAVLEAHFTRNENYVPTDEDKDGRDPIYDHDSFYQWLNERIGDQKPLDGFDKTAEVYDYENRIYRVDLTANSKMTILDGDVDLGFVIDVSSSMRFPSSLKNTDDLNSQYKDKAMDLSTINTKDRYGRTNGELWGLKKSNKTYYIITDPESTATICKLWYDSNASEWRMQDSSKIPSDTNQNIFNPADNPSGLKYWDNKPKTLLIKEADDFVHKTGPNRDTGTITTTTSYLEAADGSPKTRAMYLEASIKDAITEMYAIKQALSVASNSNPNVASTQDYAPKVAYNTFCEWVNPLQYSFVTAPQNGINITYTYKGGTSTDMALVDAAGYKRTDVGDNVYKSSNNNASSWSKEPVPANYYEKDSGRGFQWDPESNKRYVVLITDGAPQRKSENIDQSLLEDGRDKLHESGATLISVGLSMGDCKVGAGKLYAISDEDANFVPYYYKAETGDMLKNALYDILSMTIGDAIVTGNVTDTIGRAFYPVDKRTGNPLGNGDWINLDGEKVNRNYTGKHGVINVTGNTYTVTWEDQDIKTEANGGWHGSVYVKAKEDLFGANAVPTNNGQASIQTVGFKNKEGATTHDLHSDYKITRQMETPLVNVNELSVTNNETDWTVYLGQTVDPLSELQQLYNKIDVLQVIKAGTDPNANGIKTKVSTDSNTNRANTNMSFDFPAAGDLDGERSDDRTAVRNRQTFPLKSLVKQLYDEAPTNAEWKQNFNPDGTPKWDKLIKEFEENGSDLQRIGLRIPYNPYGIPGENYISLILDISGKGNEPVLTSTDTNPHATAEVGSEVEKYTLTVRYDPDYRILPKGQKGLADIETFHVGSFESRYQGNGAGREEKDNIHIINVYSKPLDVFKTDSSGEIIADKPATFRLVRPWKSDDTGSTVNLTSADGYKYKPVGENAYRDMTGKFLLIEEINTESGIAHFGAGTQLLSAAEDPYYLIEWNPPQGYQKDKNAKTIVVNPGDDFYTALNKTTSLTSAQISTQPYNWNQGVRIKVDNEAIVFVNASGQEVSLYKDTAKTQKRDYLLIDDDADIAFSTSVINEIADKCIKLLKIGINNTDPTVKAPLAGAKFTIYEATGANHSEKGSVVVIGEGADAVRLENLESQASTGLIWQGNLPMGVYLIDETDAPSGYTKMPIMIRLNVSESGVTPSIVGTAGSPSSHYEAMDPEGTGADTVYGLKIINIAGAELPNTGGSGTTLFYLFGLLLTGLAGAGLMMKKRRKLM